MPSFFSLDIRRAHEGDCLLLHYGTKADPGLAMIDGGPPNTYTPHLRPRLVRIRKARKLADSDALQVDLVMVSHVDDDHIAGILDMTKELLKAKAAHQPSFTRPLTLWHNSFDDIIGNDPAELLSKVGGTAGLASAGGQEPDDALLDDDTVDWPGGKRPSDVLVRDNIHVLASIAQGFRLLDDAKGLNIPVNAEFDGDLIIASGPGGALPPDKGVTFTVAGPMVAEVKALQKKHDDWLEDLAKSGKSPHAALAAYIDTSVHNLSSLVFLVEAGGKKILLTGDARGDKVLKGLQLVELLGPGKKSTLKVDILKVPHHGSDANLDVDFFERVIAEHYVFSGDGQHGNPERETLEMLLKARGTDPITIHLTYPIADIDTAREAEWNKQQEKERKRLIKNPNAKVREDWSGKKHSLTAFFAKHPDFAKQVVIVADDPNGDKPHLIELLDPIGF